MICYFMTLMPHSQKLKKPSFKMLIGIAMCRVLLYCCTVVASVHVPLYVCVSAYLCVNECVRVCVCEQINLKTTRWRYVGLKASSFSKKQDWKN